MIWLISLRKSGAKVRPENLGAVLLRREKNRVQGKRFFKIYLKLMYYLSKAYLLGLENKRPYRLDVASVRQVSLSHSHYLSCFIARFISRTKALKRAFSLKFRNNKLVRVVCASKFSANWDEEAYGRATAWAFINRADKSID